MNVKQKINLDTIDYIKLQKLKEKTLRRNVVIPLLNEIGAENVTDMHGSNERGIDVYFEANDIFGHKRRFGIQIKRGNIICRSSPVPNSVKEILNQIEAGFGKEILLPDSKLGKISVNIDGYYIFVSGKVNEPATDYIYQKRKAYPFVHILDGNEILKLIKERKFLKQRILEKRDSPLSITVPNRIPEN